MQKGHISCRSRPTVAKQRWSMVYELCRWEKLPVGQELPLVQTVMMDSA